MFQSVQRGLADEAAERRKKQADAEAASRGPSSYPTPQSPQDRLDAEANKLERVENEALSQGRALAEQLAQVRQAVAQVQRQLEGAEVAPLQRELGELQRSVIEVGGDWTVNASFVADTGRRMAGVQAVLALAEDRKAFLVTLLKRNQERASGLEKSLAAVEANLAPVQKRLRDLLSQSGQ